MWCLAFESLKVDVRCYIVYYYYTYYISYIISYTILYIILYSPLLLFFSSSSSSSLIFPSSFSSHSSSFQYYSPFSSFPFPLLPNSLISYFPTSSSSSSSFILYVSVLRYTYLYSINISFRFGVEYTV